MPLNTREVGDDIQVVSNHVIVGDVNVRVADSTELDVKRDIVVAGDVSLDLDLLENPVRAVLGPRHSCVHVTHPLQTHFIFQIKEQTRKTGRLGVF